MSDMDLDVLKNRIKKDPEANRDSFNHKWDEMMASFDIAKLTPQIYSDQFMKLLNFVTHTISYYTNTKDVDKHLIGDSSLSKLGEESLENRGRNLCLSLIEFVKNNRNLMDGKMRRLIISSTFMLRTKKQIDILTVLNEWLELLDLNDKDQRKKLYNFIIKDLVILNGKFKGTQIMKKLENVLIERIRSKNVDLNVRVLSCCVLVEMYRRGVWSDFYTLNQLCDICCSQNNPKIVMLIVYFLISPYQSHYNLVYSTETLSNSGLGSVPFGAAEGSSNSLEEDSEAPKSQKKRKILSKDGGGHLLDIYDPTKMIDKLLEKCQKSQLKYEHKLVVLKLAAMIVNRHRLMVPSFYAYLSKYLHYKQPLVTKVLSSLIISVHSETNLESLQPIIDHIITDFVSYDRSDSTIVLGLNTIREMCNKLPNLLNKENLDYLLQFKNYKSKNVNISVKSLINLYRKVNPKLLHKKFRDKPSNISLIKQKNEELNKSSDSPEDLSDIDDFEDESQSENDEDSQEGEDDDEDEEEEEEEEEEVDLEKKLVYNNVKKLKNFERRQLKIQNKIDKKNQLRLAQSKKGKRQSLTNKIKSRNKPLLMTLQSKRVKKKKNLSINQQVTRLKKHIKSLKKGNVKKKQRRHL